MDDVPSISMRIIGIDLGERRIGFATSDASETLATPVKTIERGSSDAVAVELLRSTITEIADGEEVGSIVVGLPRRLDGSPNLQTPRVKKMVEMLSKQLSIPVVTQDERLSSHEAEERLAFSEKDWRRRKARLDAAAAAVILQDYLDARKQVSGESGESRESGEFWESSESEDSEESE
ncbi:MAG TPA: Holliday junction resolvase RuvX [Vicinamibacterales bacterium]|jgi:putative Holliday junction resolvase|nr:Holliday junction resolvase RuvX [Vicinamibacterales bacterium]